MYALHAHIGATDVRLRFLFCLQLSAMVKKFEEAVSIIESINEKADRVQISRHQCRRLADRLKHVSPFIQQYWKADSNNIGVHVGNNHSDVLPPDEFAFANLLTVFRKSEMLVTECVSADWPSKILGRAVLQQEFEEIHESLHLCTTSLLLGEPVEPPDLKILASDAKLDETELLNNLSTTSASFYSTLAESLDSMTTTMKDMFDINHMYCPTVEDELDDLTHLPSYVQIAPSALRGERFQGIGDYGEVTKANWLLSTVVIKDFPWCGGYTDAWYDEAVPMIRYRHPRVMQLMGFVLDTKKVVTEFMLGGDLRKFIDERLQNHMLQDGPIFSLSEAMDIMRQIASALSFMHQSGYMHGDRVLTLNVMVKESQNHSLDVKIGDIGVSQKRRVQWRGDLDKPCPENLRKESIRWTAPEVYARTDGKEIVHYSAMSDIYSFGILCSEVLTGNFPFGDITDVAEVRSRVLAGERPRLPDALEPDLEQLIRECWQGGCSLRPTARKVCEKLERIMFPMPIAAPRICAGGESRFPSQGSDQYLVGEHPETAAPQVLDRQLSLPYYLRIPEADLKMIKVLGKGASACVYKAEWQSANCAVKRLFGAANILDLQREVEILMQLRHPHIVELLGFSADPCCIVMELMIEDLPSLYRRRVNTPGHHGPPFDYATTLSIIKQIASGMAHLHSFAILHRDLKGLNVLVHDHGDHVEAKVADFRVSQHTQGLSACNYIGSGFWRSPELLRAKETKAPFEYTTKEDIYSFAMTCYEVLTGKTPFQDALESYTPKRIIEMLLDPAGTWPIPRRPELPTADGVPLQLLHLIEDCWNDVPHVRPDFSEITDRLERMPVL